MTDLPGRECLQFGRVSVHLGLKKGKYPDCNQMILAGQDLQVAVDASRSTDLIAADFDRSDLVVLSHVHEDHMAGLARLPHVPVEVHHRDLAALQSWEGFCEAGGHVDGIRDTLRAEFELDFAYAPRPDATGYGDDAVWDLGGLTLRAIPTPGHTAGHCSLLVEEEELLFLADVDLSSFGPYYGDGGSSLTAFRDSLARVAEIPARVWVSGHHKGVYTDAARFRRDLEAYASVFDRRDDRLLAYLAEAPQSLADLVARRLVYPPSYNSLWAEAVERRMISQHLDALVAAGRVAEAEGLYHLR